MFTMPPIVFISYSHDSQAHKQWVLDFAVRLRASGIDAVLDQWELGPGSDLPHFMEQNLARATRVIMICTERYVEKANAGAGGVGYEKMIVTGDLLKQIGSKRVIPIVRQAGTALLPTFLGTKMYVDLSTEELFESGIDEVLRDLLDAPLFVKPDIGTTLFKSTKGTAQPTTGSPADQFMRAVEKVYAQSDENGLLGVKTVQAAMNCSKLYFDYAFDQARQLRYVKSGNGTYFWVQPEGRARLIALTGQTN